MLGAPIRAASGATPRAAMGSRAVPARDVLTVCSWPSRSEPRQVADGGVESFRESGPGFQQVAVLVVLPREQMPAVGVSGQWLIVFGVVALPGGAGPNATQRSRLLRSQVGLEPSVRPADLALSESANPSKRKIRCVYPGQTVRYAGWWA